MSSKFFADMFSAVHQHYRQTDAPDFAAGRVTGLSIGYRPAGGFFVPKKCTMYHKESGAAPERVQRVHLHPLILPMGALHPSWYIVVL